MNDVRVRVRRGRAVEEAVLSGTEPGVQLVSLLGETVDSAGVRDAARDVVKVVREVRPRLALGRVGAVSLYGLVRGLAELVVRIRGSRVADDGEPLRQQILEVWKKAGSSLRWVRSPVAPKVTTV